MEAWKSLVLYFLQPHSARRIPLGQPQYKSVRTKLDTNFRPLQTEASRHDWGHQPNQNDEGSAQLRI